MTAVYQYSIEQMDIIRDAMLNIRKLAEGEDPTAQEYTDCARKLSMILQQLGGKRDFANGIKMFQRQRGYLLLSSTQYSYALGPSASGNWTNGLSMTTTTATAAQGATTLSLTAGTQITNGDHIVITLDSGDTFSTTGTISGTTLTISTALPSQASSGSVVFNYTTKAQRPDVIETCVLRDQNGNDTPISFMTEQDYENLPQKQSPSFLSDPARIYYEPGIGQGVVYLDVAGASDVTKYLVLKYLQPTQLLQNPTDVLQMPGEWSRYICWSLSREICPMFNAVWDANMQASYTEAKMMANESDAETTTLYFQCGNDGDTGLWG